MGNKEKREQIEKSEERLKVIENIKKNVEEGKLNDKVELNDPVMTDEDREKYILHFDSLRNSISKRIKRRSARKIAKQYTKIFNFGTTKIIGLKNLEAIKTGAIITGNHFSPKDSTVIMYALEKVGKFNHLDIVIEEENVLMEGQFGFLLNNCGTIPISKSQKYLQDNFMPSIEKLLNNGDMVLIYPEEQMWFNYRKPRPCKIGAYHIATKFNVPIIPMFTEMREIPGKYDEDGFNRVKFILHIMPAIYPDESKSFKEAKKELMQKDYEAKVKAYEEAYGIKLDYTFEENDIAGLSAEPKYVAETKSISKKVEETIEKEKENMSKQIQKWKKK